MGVGVRHRDKAAEPGVEAMQLLLEHWRAFFLPKEHSWAEGRWEAGPCGGRGSGREGL